MSFDSFVFAVFFVVVYTLYLAMRRGGQNVLLLVASYVFYGYWDWRFLSLILISTTVDYVCALRIHSSTDERARRFFLTCSMVTNLGILGFFKYFDFFTTSAADLLRSLGWGVEPMLLNVVLPVGISFYTFQTMSYTIDVYRRQMEPTRRVLDFALYVAFFPQLVAGPIERARRLLPQILSDRQITMEKFTSGGWLVFWGLYKKVFVADNLARFVDPVFTDPSAFSAPHIMLATYAFAFQIYCDFSGYTDIARGVARMMGFELMLNFNLPYFAVSPSDFWRRWHISLSQWLRDYLYIPLGGNRGGQNMVLRNLMLTMALGGLWHGAQWNFVAWGLFHGGLLVAWRLFGSERAENPATRWGRVAAIAGMFHLTCIGWVLFRVESLRDVGLMAGRFFRDWSMTPEFTQAALAATGYVIIVVAIQVLQYIRNDLDAVRRLPVWLRVTLYMVMYFSLTIGGAFGARQFIYFQF